MKVRLVMMPSMTHRVRHALLALLCCVPLALPSTARAQDEEEVPDARLMGYQEPVNLGGGNAGNYILLGFLAVLTCGILFKNANRSHLD